MNTGSEAQNIFLNLEKRNHVGKHIRKLVISGVITTDPFNILNEQKRFYNDLYKSKLLDTNHEAVKTFLSNLNVPTLSEEQKRFCEGEISLEELKAVLDSFQSNKTSGNDGIPIEFYKVCWDLISDSFMECAKESYNRGKMSSSQRKVVITLIEKHGKDRILIENPFLLLMSTPKLSQKQLQQELKKCCQVLSTTIKQVMLMIALLERQ